MCIQFTLDFICHFMTKSFSVLRSSCYSLWSTPVLTVLNLEGRILDAGFCGQSNSFPQFVSVFFFVRFLSVFNWLGKPALLYRGSRLFALKLKKKNNSLEVKCTVPTFFANILIGYRTQSHPVGLLTRLKLCIKASGVTYQNQKHRASHRFFWQAVANVAFY